MSDRMKRSSDRVVYQRGCCPGAAAPILIASPGFRIPEVLDDRVFLSHLDFKALSFWAADERLGLVVTDHSFAFWIPFDPAAQAGCDAGEMTGRQCPMMAAGIGNRVLSGRDTFEKIGQVIGQRSIAIDFFEGSVRQWI